MTPTCPYCHTRLANHSAGVGGGDGVTATPNPTALAAWVAERKRVLARVQQAAQDTAWSEGTKGELRMLAVIAAAATVEHDDDCGTGLHHFGESLFVSDELGSRPCVLCDALSALLGGAQ